VATSTIPTIDGSSYLKVSANNNSATGDGVAVVRRQFMDEGINPTDVKVNDPYIVKFDYRVDVAFSGANISQRYTIMGSSGNGTSTGGTNTWMASVYSGATGTASEIPSGFAAGNVGKWGFINNTGGSTVAISSIPFVDSGIAMVVGTVYHFEIEVDPDNKQYKPSVSDGTNSFTAAGYLGFRNKDATALTASWLHFNLGLTTTSADLGYSVDNLEITVVPEPNALLLASIGMIGASVCGLRRRSAVRN
jgi:hypothetical protein